MLKIDLEINKRVVIINFRGSLMKKDLGLLTLLFKVIRKHQFNKIIYNMENLKKISLDSLDKLDELIEFVYFKEGRQLVIKAPRKIKNIKEVKDKEEALLEILR